MDTVQFFITHTYAFFALVAITSLLVGSFINVVIYRLPLMLKHSWSEECRLYLKLQPNLDTYTLNLCLPLSHCPTCKQAIKPWHNIPLISYVWLCGKCAHCNQFISLRYPLVELLTCVLSLFMAWHFHVTWALLAALLFTWINIAMLFIDLDHFLLPDELTFTLLWLGLLCSIFSIFCNSHDAIIGAIMGYLIFAFVQWAFYLVTKKHGIGHGDLKYLAALGACLGWQTLPTVILLASLCGIVITLTPMILKRNFNSLPVPFGPYLALAGWITLLWEYSPVHAI